MRVQESPLGLIVVWVAGNPLVRIPLAALVVMWLISTSSRSGNPELEAAILKVPGVGWLYQHVFAPETYYRIDSMLMFQSAVHAAMLEVIDGLLASKGLRALSENERRPVFRELALGGADTVPRALASSAAGSRRESSELAEVSV
jgi:hypothetical protein